MRVGVPGRAYRPCGQCWECTNTGGDPKGYGVACPRAGNNGITRNGGFAQYTLVDARQVAQLPDVLTEVEAAPLMCAGLTIYAALLKCGLQKGGKVGIIGAGGGLGHLGLQFGVEMGLNVIGVDASDDALNLAKQLGTAAKIFDARITDPVDLLRQIGQTEDDKVKGEMGLEACNHITGEPKGIRLWYEVVEESWDLCGAIFPQVWVSCLCGRPGIQRHPGRRQLSWGRIGF